MRRFAPLVMCLVGLSIVGGNFGASVSAAPLVRAAVRSSSGGGAGSGWTARSVRVAKGEQVNVAKLPPASGGGLAVGLPLLIRDQGAYAAAKKNPAGRPGYAITQPGATSSNLKTAIQSSNFNQNFAGITSRIDQGQLAASVEPPDTQVAVSSTRVVEMVNSVVQIYDRAGNAVGGVFALDPFFIVNSSSDPSLPGGWAGLFFNGEHLVPTDPRILYDPTTGRWYASILAYGPNSFDSVTLLGISQSSDPGAGWVIYVIDVEGPQSQNFTPMLCDQPKLGYSSDKFVIGCNLFDFSRTFQGGMVMIANKAQGLTGANLVEDEFVNMSRFAPVGAVNLTGGVATAYATFNESLTGTAATGVWTFTGTVTGDSTSDLPKIATHSVAMPATAAPPSAPQSGAATAIDTGDDRYNSAFVQSGALYTSGGESCTPAGDTLARSCLRLVEVNLSTFGLIQGATAGIVGEYLINPTLGVNSLGDVVFEYSTSSSTTDPDTEVAIQPVADPNTFVGGGVLAGNTAAYTGTGGTTFRWGDYGAVAVDPAFSAYVYVGGEFSNSDTIIPNWSTQIGEINGHITQVCASPTLLPNFPSPQKPNVDITLTASATCARAATPDFQFWILPPGGSWGIVQDYGNGATFDWASHVTLGTYSIQVRVRATTETAKAFDSYVTISYMISATPCTTPTLGTDLASPQIVGTTVTITGNTTCADTTPQYAFYVRTPDLVWHLIQAYSPTNTTTWNTFDTQIGSYLLEVLIKNTGSTAAYDSFTSLAYQMLLCTATTLTPSASSPYASGAGAITLTAGGACAGSTQFRFYFKDTAGVWHLLQDYSASNTASWSADYKAGGYTLLAEIRPGGSSATLVSYVFLPFTLSGCTSATLTPNPNSPQPKGTSVMLTATATCTGASADFQFWVRSPAGVWTMIQDYGHGNTVTWSAPTIAGTYVLEVLARNTGATNDPFDAYVAINYMLS